MEKLKKTIKTQEEYDSFCLAVNNYVALCKKEGRTRSYIRMWITFVNHWQDYLELDGDPTPTNDNDDQLRRILNGPAR